MLAVQKIHQAYESAYAIFNDNVRLSEPHWYRQQREHGFNEWNKPAFLTGKSEDWKYTYKPGFFFDHMLDNLCSIDSSLPLIGKPSVDFEAIALSVIDGVYSPIQDQRQIPGIELRYAHELDHAGHAVLTKTHERAAEQDGFAQLNRAFHPHALVMRVTALQPKTVLYLNHTAVSPGVNYPRFYLQLGRDQDISVVEHFQSSRDERIALTNAATFITIDQGSRLHYAKVIEQAPSSCHISQAYANLDSHASLSTTTLNLKGEKVRSQQQINLCGEHAQANINGVLLTSKDQLCDNRVVINHRAAHTKSQCQYMGLATDNSVATFNGRIFMQTTAQHASATLRNPNLLLSPAARINTKPELEIYANNVKCTHGATVGKIDPQQMLYLQSRGLSENLARRLITTGFLKQGMNAIPAALGAWAEKLITAAAAEIAD